MKVISLNIWGGRVFQPLMDFFHEKKEEIDIFCLQEVWSHHQGAEEALKKAPQGTKVDILSHLVDALPEFQVFFAPAQDQASGLAIFVKRGHTIGHLGDPFIFRSRDSMVENDGRTLGRNLQYIQFDLGGKKFTISHFHGLWTGDGKKDTPSRIEQSKKVRSILDPMEGAKILCGDFNVVPNTESLNILERNMRNLIDENGITSTRSHYYGKSDRFADYILISPDVEVIKFEVLPHVVSDHLPLYLEFN